MNVLCMMTVAPLKALCNEKYKDWSSKFARLHQLKCSELTSDTDMADESNIETVSGSHIICTTPVSWFNGCSSCIGDY